MAEENVGQYMQTSGIGDHKTPDLPVPDPKSKGYTRPQDKAEKGGKYGAIQTVPCGAPWGRSNHEINPDRQMYCSIQGSSYSKNDPRRMKWIDDISGASLGNASEPGWIGQLTHWQSGPSQNEPVMDHTCENAGYWSTNNGLNSNWQNWDDNSGKAYKPALIEAVASGDNAGKCMLYNLGHGTPHSTPAGLEHNVVGASGFISPHPEQRDVRDGGDKTYANMRVKHMYIMYQLDITEFEWDQYQEDFEGWDDWLEELHDSLQNQRIEWLLEPKTLEFFERKVPYRESYCKLLRGLRKMIGEHWKRDVPSVDPMIEQMKEGTLTIDDIFMYVVRNDVANPRKPVTDLDLEKCPYTFEQMFHFDRSKRAKWWAHPEEEAGWFNPETMSFPEGFADLDPARARRKERKSGMYYYRKAVEKEAQTKGKVPKPPKPPSGGGGLTGLGDMLGRPGGHRPGNNNNGGNNNNNRPGRPGGGNNNGNRPIGNLDPNHIPDRPDNINMHPADRDYRDRYQARQWRQDLHDAQYPNCSGPPCQHYGHGPENGRHPDGSPADWTQTMWEAYHKKMYPTCNGKWNAKGNGRYCKHQPPQFDPNYNGSGADNKWNAIDERTKKHYFNKWHAYHIDTAECPGRWDPNPGHPQLKATNGYCCHHPEYENNLPPEWRRPDDMPDRRQNIVGGGDANRPNVEINPNNQQPDNIRDQLNPPNREDSPQPPRDFEFTNNNNDGPVDNIHIGTDENGNSRVEIGIDNELADGLLEHEIPDGGYHHNGAHIDVNDNGNIEIDFPDGDLEVDRGNLDGHRLPDDGIQINAGNGAHGTINQNDNNNIEIHLEDIGPDNEHNGGWFDWDDWNERDPIIRDPDADRIESDEELLRRLENLRDQGVNIAPGVDIHVPELDPNNPNDRPDRITIEIDPEFFNPDNHRPDNNNNRPGNHVELPDGGVDLHGGTHIDVGPDHEVDINIPNVDTNGWPDNGYDLGNGTTLRPDGHGGIELHRPGVNEPHNRPTGDNLPPEGIDYDWGSVRPGQGGEGVDVHLPSGSIDQDSLDRIPDNGLDLPNGGEVVKNPDGSLEIRLRDPADFDHVIGHIETNNGNHYEIYQGPHTGDIIIEQNGRPIDLGDIPAEDLNQIEDELDRLHGSRPPNNGSGPPPILEGDEDRYKELFDRINTAYKWKEGIKNFLQWAWHVWEKIEFYAQFGLAGAIVAAIELATKSLLFIFTNSFATLKEADYLAELKVHQKSCDKPFPINHLLETGQTDYTVYRYDQPREEFFNLMISPFAQIFVNMFKCRFNGYLVDARCSDRGGILGGISRLQFSYLQPTYSPGFCALDFEMAQFRRLVRQYPDPVRGKNGSVNYYLDNPRKGRWIALQRYENQMQRQAEWSDVCEEHLSYFRPDFANIIKGPSGQWDFKTQGDTTWKTGTCEEGWGEVWADDGSDQQQQGHWLLHAEHL